MKKVPARQQANSAARLYAVQALFQMEQSGQGVDEVAREFAAHRFGATYDDAEMADGNPELFRSIISDAVDLQAMVDQATDRALVAAWPLGRIDPTLRALFRAAGAELMRGAAPARVVINEFMDVARAFYPGGREGALVNAVLDHMARELRANEF